MRPRVGPPAACVLAAAVSAACVGAAPSASVGSPATPIPVEQVTIQLDFNITPTLGTILWGIDRGYFEEQGIDLELLPGQGSDLALQQIDAGQVDFAFVDGSNYLTARVQGITETTAIYALINVSTTAITAKVELNEPQDMVGMSFGTIPQSSGRQKIPLVLQQNGIDPAQVPIELMDFGVLYPTLFLGGIDTAEVGYPGDFGNLFLSAQDEGITLYATSISDWGFRDYSKLLIARNEVIDGNPDLVGRLVAALDRSQDALADADAAAIYDLVSVHDPLTRREALERDWPDIQATVVNPGPMDDATFQYQLDILESSGTPVTIEPADLYTNQFIPGS